MNELKTTIQIPSLSEASVIQPIEKEESSIFSFIFADTFCSVSDMCEVMVSIEANPYNSMKGKYILYAVSQKDIKAEILPKLSRSSSTNAEILPQILAKQDLFTVIDVVYDGRHEVWAEIHPFIHSEISTEIEVPPHNRMTAIYEIQQPPILTEIRTPIKDAFTRENQQYAAINYGFTTTMAVGTSDEDIWRGYIEYNLNNFPKNYRIVSTIMRLHYKGTLNKNVMLEVNDLKESWQEYSITNLNRPTPLSTITDIYEINQKEKYIDFEITEPIEQWLHGEKLNNGFLIRPTNETYHTSASFYTRESHKPPQLIIKYYDERIYSFGRADVSATVNVVLAANSDKLTVVEPTGLFSVLDEFVEVQCHVKGQYLFEDCNSEITVSTPKKIVEISSRRSGEIQEFAEVGVIGYSNKDFYVELDVTRTNTNSEIFIRYRNDIFTEVFSLYLNSLFAEVEVNKRHSLAIISAIVSGNSETLAECIATKPNIEAEIVVQYATYKDVKVELDVFPYPKTDKETVFEVTRKAIPAELFSRQKETANIRTEVEVTNSSKLVEIFSKYKSNLLVEITPNIKSDVNALLDVTQPNIFAEVVAREIVNNDAPTMVIVQQILDADVEFFIRYTDDLDIEVDVRMVSDTLAEITSNTPTRLSEITVPYLAESDMWVVVYPKIYAVNDMPAMIFVGSGNGAYAFII